MSRYREILKFLIARLIYNDGLVTVFAFGGIYAAGTFGLALSEVIVFGVAINIAAGLGALALGALARIDAQAARSAAVQIDPLNPFAPRAPDFTPPACAR